MLLTSRCVYDRVRTRFMLNLDHFDPSIHSLADFTSTNEDVKDVLETPVHVTQNLSECNSQETSDRASCPPEENILSDSKRLARDLRNTCILLE